MPILMKHPGTFDYITAPDALVAQYEARGWVRLVPGAPEPPELLRGKALDAALKSAGLPTVGAADEKRARLAEHNSHTTPTLEEQA